MKKITFLLCFIVGALTVNSQGIQLFDKNGNPNSKDTVFIYPKYCGVEFENYEIKDITKVVNKTNSTMTIGLIRYEIGVSFGTGNAVCWGATCFGEKPAGSEPTWDVPDSAIVAPNDTASGLDGFVAYHFPNQTTGENKYLFEFYSREDPSISDSIYVFFVVDENQPDSLLIKDQKKNSVHGDTITINAEIDPLAPNAAIELPELVNVINSSCSVDTIGLRRIEHTVIPGTGDAVCWGNTCFPQQAAGSNPVWDVNDSVIAGPVFPAEGDKDFMISFYPNQITGESLYEYEFYERENPSMTSSVFVKIITTEKDPEIKFVANDAPQYEAGDTLFYLIDVDSSLTQEINVSNTFSVLNYSTDPINVGVSREELVVVSGSDESLCWADSCSARTAAGTNQVINFGKSVLIASNDSAKGADVFKAKIYPNNSTGTALYRYDFFDINNPSNSSSIFIKFDLEYITGLDEKELATADFSMYPNPTSDKLFFSFSNEVQTQNDQIVIRDIIGNTVIETNAVLLGNDSSIDISSLTPGIYLVSLLNNHAQVTKKLIIK